MAAAAWSLSHKGGDRFVTMVKAAENGDGDDLRRSGAGGALGDARPLHPRRSAPTTARTSPPIHAPGRRESRVWSGIVGGEDHHRDLPRGPVPASPLRPEGLRAHEGHLHPCLERAAQLLRASRCLIRGRVPSFISHGSLARNSFASAPPPLRVASSPDPRGKKDSRQDCWTPRERAFIMWMNYCGWIGDVNGAPRSQMGLPETTAHQ